MRSRSPATALPPVWTLLAVVLASLTLASPRTAGAAEPSAAATHAIEQPAQPVAETLRSIAQQTGASVLFDPGVVSGRTSRPVSGRMSAAEAISRALGGSGLSAEVMKDGAIVVKPAGSAAPATTGAQSTSLLSGGNGAAAAPLDRLAQGPASTMPSSDTAPSPPSAAPLASFDTVEVTGSRLKRVAAEGPMPVNTYSQEEIQRSGQPTLERFLSSLNEVSVAAGEGTFGATAGQGTVQLRGLPLGSTLTLINGRRVQAVGSSAGNYFNLNLIPLAAVERIEILPVGSSAVYGGEALAGVVNVILKKSINGMAFDARAGSANGMGDGNVSLTGGGSNERGSFLLLGSYEKRSPLTMAERSRFQDADYRRYGAADQRVRTCTPGTVSSANGANLPGLGSSFAAIPVASAGQALTPADFAPNAGTANLCSGQSVGRGYTLINGSETLALHASGEYQLAGTWAAFGELTRTEDRLWVNEAALTLSNVLVPARNPYNPFGVDVRVSSALGTDNGVQTFERKTYFTRAVLGVRGDIGGGWDLELTGSTSRDNGKSHSAGVSANGAARAAALGSTAADLALNPFTPGQAASDDVLQAIWPETLRINHGKRDQLGAFVRGSLLELPAGPLETIVGAESARDRFESIVPAVVAVTAQRTQQAGYTELRAPLLRATPSSATPWDLAALTLAARRDHYSDFGSAGTYQGGLEVRPVQTLLLRGSIATSFKPPTLVQTHVPDQSIPSEAFGLTDPARSGQPVVGAQVIRTTNPTLGPERGKAYSLGAVWEPDGATGPRLGATAWKLRINNLIGLAFPQVLVNNEQLFSSLITRGPADGAGPGPITQVLWGEVNYGKVDTSGLDLDASQAFKALGGTWTLAAGTTRTFDYRVLLSPSAPEEDRLGRRFYDFWSPRWKSRVAAGFERGSWAVGLTSRYLGAYKDMGTSQRGLGDTWTHDVSASLDLVKAGLVSTSFVTGATVSLAVVNIADRKPEFVETNPFFDSSQADWRGRYGSVRLSVAW